MSQPFLFQAVDRAGRRVTERVEAGTLSQARFALELRGYREIEFFGDETQANIDQMVAATSDLPPLDPELWTADDQLASMRRRGIGAHLWWVCQQQMIFIAPLAAWNAFTWLGGRPFGWGDWLGFAVGVGYVAIFLKVILPHLLFTKILEASIWSDWAQVRRFVGWARRLRRIMVVGVPEAELDFREAQALAAEGRVEEARLRVGHYRGHPDFPEHLYLSRLSGLHEHAGDFPAALGCLEKAAEINPRGVTEWIDVACARVRWFGDVEGARAALARVAEAELAVLPRAAVRLCEGMIAVELGQHVQARAFLTQAIADLRVFGNPQIEVLVAEARGYLVLALAPMGEREEAAERFAEARPLLKVAKPPVLLERCRAALAAAATATVTVMVMATTTATVTATVTAMAMATATAGIEKTTT